MGAILFLAHRVPYPPNRGDKIRSWHILQRLCDLAPVHVAALCDDNRDMAHLRFINRHAKTVAVFPRLVPRDEAMFKAITRGGPASVHAFASRDLKLYVRDLLASQPISTIFAFSGQMAQFVPHDVGERRFVMDFVDMDSAKYAEWGAGTGLAARANRFEARRLFAFEQRTAHRADVSTFVSAAEAALFRGATGLAEDKVKVLENGIDLARFAPDARLGGPIPGRVVFTGQMDYGPNIDAVTQFVSQVWPRVRTQMPGATFAIVGRAPTPRVLALASDDVIVTGEVADTRDWLQQASVVVAPLMLARGVQNKVLEAMAMAKAVVASPAAAEGIDAAPDRDLLVGTTPEAQAAHIVHLLHNAEIAAALGCAARRQMEARYSWARQLAHLPAVMGMAA